MSKLNQIIAVEKGIKSRAHSSISELYKIVQKPELFSGISKSYQANSETGEVLPPEKKKVQYNVEEVLRQLDRSCTELFNVTARKDYTNCVAKASVKVGDRVLVKDAPVSFILFLEKQMQDVLTFVNALPVLDEADEWKKDPNHGFYTTAPYQTHRTTKVQEPLVLYPATPEHPAQTQIITKDVITGYWTTIKQSGAISKTDKKALKENVETLLKALKEAREEANATDEVKVEDIGQAIFDYLLEA